MVPGSTEEGITQESFLGLVLMGVANQGMTIPNGEGRLIPVPGQGRLGRIFNHFLSRNRVDIVIQIMDSMIASVTDSRHAYFMIERALNSMISRGQPNNVGLLLANMAASIYPSQDAQDHARDLVIQLINELRRSQTNGSFSLILSDMVTGLDQVRNVDVTSIYQFLLEYMAADDTDDNVRNLLNFNSRSFARIFTYLSDNWEGLSRWIIRTLNSSDRSTSAIARIFNSMIANGAVNENSGITAIIRFISNVLSPNSTFTQAQRRVLGSLVNEMFRLQTYNEVQNLFVVLQASPGGPNYVNHLFESMALEVGGADNVAAILEALNTAEAHPQPVYTEQEFLDILRANPQQAWGIVQSADNAYSYLAMIVNAAENATDIEHLPHDGPAEVAREFARMLHHAGSANSAVLLRQMISRGEGRFVGISLAYIDNDLFTNGFVNRMFRELFEFMQELDLRDFALTQVTLVLDGLYADPSNPSIYPRINTVVEQVLTAMRAYPEVGIFIRMIIDEFNGFPDPDDYFGGSRNAAVRNAAVPNPQEDFYHATYSRVAMVLDTMKLEDLGWILFQVYEHSYNLASGRTLVDVVGLLQSMNSDKALEALYHITENFLFRTVDPYEPPSAPALVGPQIPAMAEFLIEMYTDRAARILSGMDVLDFVNLLVEMALLEVDNPVLVLGDLLNAMGRQKSAEAIISAYDSENTDGIRTIAQVLSTMEALDAAEILLAVEPLSAVVSTIDTLRDNDYSAYESIIRIIAVLNPIRHIQIVNMLSADPGSHSFLSSSSTSNRDDDLSGEPGEAHGALIADTYDHFTSEPDMAGYVSDGGNNRRTDNAQGRLSTAARTPITKPSKPEPLVLSDYDGGGVAGFETDPQDEASSYLVQDETGNTVREFVIDAARRNLYYIKQFDVVQNVSDYDQLAIDYSSQAYDTMGALQMQLRFTNKENPNVPNFWDLKSPVPLSASYGDWTRVCVELSEVNFKLGVDWQPGCDFNLDSLEGIAIKILPNRSDRAANVIRLDNIQLLVNENN